MKKFSLTIGISAYNEAANIAFLLEDILKQRRESFVVERIVVVSDGSTDETASVARRYESDGVCVIDDGERKGKSRRSNEILEMSRGADAVILLDADIVVIGDTLFESLLRFVREGFDVVSPELRALSPKNMFGSAIVSGHELKNRMFSEWKGGENIYQCHGAARALSRRFVEKFRFKESVGEDAYSYLFAKKHGFRYISIREAAVAIRVPESLRDHEKQSRRFLVSQGMFSGDFGEEVVSKEYRYPRLLLVKHLFRIFFARPFAISSYIVIMIYVSLFSRKPDISQVWSVVSSSKSVR